MLLTLISLAYMSEIRDRAASDTKLLPALLDTTARNSAMREVSADKGYSGINNTNAVAKHGATPFIASRTASIRTR
jgi:hypothetical protein